MNSSILPFCPGTEKLIVKSKDCYQYDADGNEYIDFESGVWCTNIGHCHKLISKLIRKQSRKSIHHGYRFRNKHTEQLSAELQRLVGFEKGASVFLSSGSEAVNLAITMSNYLTGRKKVLKIDNSYISAYGHGRISPENHDLVTVKYNDIYSIHDIDFSSISAFVMETGGASVDMVRFPDEQFIKQLSETLIKNHCLIIAEEVTTGFGRMGKWFGYQYYDVIPDMVVTGKALGNGFPVSALTVNSIVAEKFGQNPFRYAQSHQNDPLGCAIGLEVIKIIEEADLITKGNATGRYFREQLERIKSAHNDKIKDVRARGLMLALEFAEDFNGERINNQLFEKGFVIGFKSNTLRFLPPLTIKIKDIDRMIRRLEELLDL
ncbi:MAG TPA: aspartate aminotransferase family protein [Bacteroidales bacterium]